MVMIPPVLAGGTGTAAAGSVGAAGSATGTSTFPGAESHGGWEADDIFYVPEWALADQGYTVRLSKSSVWCSILLAAS